MTVWHVAALCVALLARLDDAHAAEECEYAADSQHPSGYASSCFVDLNATLGCPVRFLGLHGYSPGAVVYRDGIEVTLPMTFTVESTFDSTFYTKDFDSCDCAELSYQLPLDAIALEIMGAREGDVVAVYAAGDVPLVTIGPAGTCGMPTWATRFHAYGACDLCPVDLNDGGGGCSVSSGLRFPCALPIAGALFAAFVSSRRRASRGV